MFQLGLRCTIKFVRKKYWLWVLLTRDHELVNLVRIKDTLSKRTQSYTKKYRRGSGSTRRGEKGSVRTTCGGGEAARRTRQHRDREGRGVSGLQRRKRDPNRGGFRPPGRGWATERQYESPQTNTNTIRQCSKCANRPHFLS